MVGPMAHVGTVGINSGHVPKGYGGWLAAHVGTVVINSGHVPKG